MPHGVIVGVLLAVEPDAIRLSGGVRIIIPAALGDRPTLGGDNCPIGCSVTVLVDQLAGQDPIAVSIKRSSFGLS